MSRPQLRDTGPPEPRNATARRGAGAARGVEGDRRIPLAPERPKSKRVVGELLSERRRLKRLERLFAGWVLGASRATLPS